METSDSECFESADEDFLSSEDESESTKTETKNISEKNEPAEDNEKCGKVQKEECGQNCTPVTNQREKESMLKICDHADKFSKSKHVEIATEISVIDIQQKEAIVEAKKENQKVEQLPSEEHNVNSKISVKKKNDIQNGPDNQEVEKTRERLGQVNVHKVDSDENSETAGAASSSKLEFERKTTDNTSNEGFKNLVCDKDPHKSLSGDAKSVQKATLKVTADEENMWDINNDWSSDWQDNDNLAKESNKKNEKNEDNKKIIKKMDTEEDLWKDDEITWGDEKISELQKNNEENLWEPDEDWESVDDVKGQVDTDNSWGGWGNWDVSTILNTATQGVSTLTTQVSHGLTSVLESGIGAPDPQEMARIVKLERERQEQESLKRIVTDDLEETPAGFGFGNLGNLVSGVTKLVETTSSKMISGGLGTLETIGKKTMEVLQEGDPGLKKKRSLLKLHQDKPILSQVLREAKERAEEENTIREQQHLARNTKNYETLFDDFQGLVHLEALEMLSRQCDIKLETLRESIEIEKLSEMQETMDQVKELCELPEDEDEEQLTFEEVEERLETAVKELNIAVSYGKLISTWKETDDWLGTVKLEFCNENELHQQAIEVLAQITALAVEQFHKGAELLLVKEHRSTADEADSLVQLTTSLKSLMLLIAGKFTEKINKVASKDSNKERSNDLITNVFFEAGNSSSYIQNAFQLLIPILQVGAV